MRWQTSKIADCSQCKVRQSHQCQRKCGCGKGTACGGLPDGNRGEHGIHHHQCGGAAYNSDLRIPAGTIPLLKAQKRDPQILLRTLDKREGDLTRRVSVHAKSRRSRRSATASTCLWTKLGIFSGDREQFNQNGISVVGEVRDSVVTSNGSVSDLSALTEELFCHDGGEMSAMHPSSIRTPSL